MDVHTNIGYYTFPKQSGWLGRAVEVCFNYDTKKTLPGRVVRDDWEEPGLCIIKLTDGRFILATECQFKLAD